MCCDSQLSELDEQRRSELAEMGLTRHRASNDAKALQMALGPWQGRPRRRA